MGEQYNANTGLYYLRARYMNPSTGTFATMDSYQGNIYEPASLHKYMYANTNPVMNIDPSGYCSMPELCVGMTALEVLKASIKFITISTLVGGFVGGILGGIDAALGGAGTKEIWKEALMGLGIGLALGAAISTLMCFSVIFPILQVVVQVFRVVLFTLGMVGALVSYQEGNTAQAIFRALLSLFSFVMLGKQIKGFELMRLKGNGGGNPSENIVGTSYDANKLIKTQPDINTSNSVVKSIAQHISENGPNSVNPISVRVHKGLAYIVDGHHRYAAFIELGYDRVPIKYLHSSNLGKMLPDGTWVRSLSDILEGAKICK